MKRGLVLAAPHLDAMILDHPRAGDLPAYLATDPDRDELAWFLDADHGQQLVDDLVDAGLLHQSRPRAHHRPARPPRRAGWPSRARAWRSTASPDPPGAPTPSSRRCCVRGRAGWSWPPSSPLVPWRC